MSSLIALTVFFLLSFAAALFGAQFPPGDWYAQLEKPSWNPPNWVFAPVWTILYAAMAVAAWLVWREGTSERRAPLAFWTLQLVLNALWSWIFFGLHRPGWAAIEIGLLWIAILATTILFFRVRRVAGALLLPYLAWVSFAAVLNVALWWLNR
ncbi:MAG: tryptophan-rich sensory protein [Acidobacteria bacterium]|nr:MAG: tryptophan-rich sensory protein [Acidobacteriota bacterium]